MRATMMMLVVTAGVLAASAQVHALGQKRARGPARQQVHGPAGDAPKRATSHHDGNALRPRPYREGDPDLARLPGTQLPSGPGGERYRLLRPRPGGHFLIERTRPGEAGLERGYSRLGFAGRRFRRYTFCTRGCGAGQIDPSVYRQQKLGGVGLDSYRLWLPLEGHGPSFIERVVGVTQFADLSPLNL